MKKEVILFNEEHCPPLYDWPPINAGGFMAWFMAILSTIPIEDYASATIELGAEVPYYDENPVPSLRIAYTREETLEEKAARVQEKLDMLAKEEERDRRTYDRLRAKFEGEPKSPIQS